MILYLNANILYFVLVTDHAFHLEHPFNFFCYFFPFVKWWWWWWRWRWWWRFLWNGWPTKVVFLAGTIARDSHHRESSACCGQGWTWAEPGFRFCWMKLCVSDNHHTTAPSLLFSSLFLNLETIWRVKRK